MSIEAAIQHKFTLPLFHAWCRGLCNCKFTTFFPPKVKCKVRNPPRPPSFWLYLYKIDPLRRGVGGGPYDKFIKGIDKFKPRGVLWGRKMPHDEIQEKNTRECTECSNIKAHCQCTDGLNVTQIGWGAGVSALSKNQTHVACTVAQLGNSLWITLTTKP